jgi:putative oxidoreductase
VKIVYLVARIVLGLIFFVFGLNDILNFIPTPPLTGLIADFTTLFMRSHYLAYVGVFQVAAGALLLLNRYVPLAIAVLAPVLANILFIHLAMQPQGLPPAILATVLWAIVFWPNRAVYAPIFAP